MFVFGFAVGFVFALFCISFVFACTLLRFRSSSTSTSTSKSKSESSQPEEGHRHNFSYVRELLERTRRVNVSGETCAWLNAVLTRLFGDLLEEKFAELSSEIKEKVETLKVPEFIGERKVDLDFGRTVPIIHKVAVLGDEDILTVLCNVEVMSDAFVAVSTELCINFIVEKFASLPVSFSVSDFRLAGQLLVSVEKSIDLDTKEVDMIVKFAFDQPPRVDYSLSTSLGEKRKLRNLSIIHDVVDKQLHKALSETVVFPNYHEMRLPLTRRRKETERGGGNDASELREDVDAVMKLRRFRKLNVEKGKERIRRQNSEEEDKKEK